MKFLETGKVEPDPKPEEKDDGVKKVVVETKKDDVKLSHVEL